MIKNNNLHDLNSKLFVIVKRNLIEGWERLDVDELNKVEDFYMKYCIYRKKKRDKRMNAKRDIKKLFKLYLFFFKLFLPKKIF